MENDKPLRHLAIIMDCQEGQFHAYSPRCALLLPGNAPHGGRNPCFTLCLAADLAGWHGRCWQTVWLADWQ